ncbi:MAG: phosphatase PAP2 family protein [Gammaproteobacteria bacterium]
MLGFPLTALQAKTASEYAVDAKDYALAPLHWNTSQWEYAAGAVAAIAATYSVDNRGRERFVGDAPAAGDPHQWRDAAPAAALTLATLAFGKLFNDSAATRTGYDMIEAIALGGISSTLLKKVGGRARPNATSDRTAWRSNGESFPSGHTTAAFAAAQVFADRAPPGQWGWSALAYGLAVATACARLDGNVHWTSDVVAGAALGIATGRFVTNRDVDSKSRISLSIQPTDGGAMLTFGVKLN